MRTYFVGSACTRRRCHLGATTGKHPASKFAIAAALSLVTRTRPQKALSCIDRAGRPEDLSGFLDGISRKTGRRVRTLGFCERGECSAPGRNSSDMFSIQATKSKSPKNVATKRQDGAPERSAHSNGNQIHPTNPDRAGGKPHPAENTRLNRFAIFMPIYNNPLQGLHLT